VSLPAFWARRARRILPAALTVLLACVIGTVVLVPPSHWEQFLGEVRASTAYVQNWQLASDAVDYLGASNATSPVQHFWSLSAEEQFYLVWPVLLLAAAVAARGRRSALAVAMGTITVASLAYSIHETAVNPAAAYFVTPTRAWEFGAGGLLALARTSDGVAAPLRAVVSWAGLAAIGLTAALYSETTPFPGYAALLPALGTLAVIWAGAPALRWAPTPALSLPPVQAIGDVSYSIYLWHLPLIVLAPFALGGDAPDRIATLMLILIAAFLTKLLVEDPVRHGRLLARRDPRWTFAAVAAATAFVLGVTGNASSELKAQLAREQIATDAALANRPTCFGASARDPRHPCVNPKLRLSVAPTPLAARDRPNAPCELQPTRGLIQECLFGVPRRRASGVIALIGDSHASHWRAALAVVAKARNWHGVSIARSGCPLTAARKDLRSDQDEVGCVRWNRQVLAWLRSHPEVSAVFVSQITGSNWHSPSGNQFATAAAGYARAWRAAPRSVKRIVVIRDTPASATETHACVERAMARERPAGPACALPRRDALIPDPAAVAATRRGVSRARLVDLTRFICGRTQCFPVVGGALVYKDQHHLTSVFATTLGPYLLRAVDNAFGADDAAAAGTPPPRTLRG
jgi:peptidoglycan/LPS O-acetylase OafA/YrhL